MKGWALRDRERDDREEDLAWEGTVWGLLQTREGALPWGLQTMEVEKPWVLRMMGEELPWALPLETPWEQKNHQHRGHQWI